MRESVVELVMETTFAVPTALSEIVVAVPEKDYKVKEQNGALMRVSPEELTTAFVWAVARDIARGETDDVLQKWRDIMLTTTCKFVLLPTCMVRYRAALRLREKISNTPMDHYWAALKQREKIPHRDVEWDVSINASGDIEWGESECIGFGSKF